jgi:hypothetical protein
MEEEKNHDAQLDHFQAKIEALQPGAALVPPHPTVAKVIEETLTEARRTVAAGEFWPLTTRIIHPDGIQTLRARGYEGTLEQKRQIAITTEATRKALNASAVIMVSDAWTCTSEEDGRPSLSPNRTEALIVVFWGADHISRIAAEPYSRSNGDVEFQPLAEFEVTAINPFCTANTTEVEEKLAKIAANTDGKVVVIRQTLDDDGNIHIPLDLLKGE